MKITPISSIYRPKFEIKKKPFEPQKALNPIRIEFTEAPEPFAGENKRIFRDMVIIVAVMGGIFLIAMNILKKGVL